MTAVLFQLQQKVESCECCQCGYNVLMSEDFARMRKRDHRNWHCTSCGTRQHWPGKSDVDKLRDELEQERRRTQWARDNAANERTAREATERQLSAQKAAKTRLRNRIKHGVCPCCSRSFDNLRRHMQTKHPEFQPEDNV